MMIKGWQMVAAVTFFMSACGGPSSDGAVSSLPTAGTPAPPETQQSVASNLDRWLGRWNGPEGTYLSIAKSGEGYTLEIADLDGPKRYEAVGVGSQIQFERNGKVESIRATDGEQTGMKWLLEKSDCLTINPGEGFCRD